MFSKAEKKNFKRRTAKRNQKQQKTVFPKERPPKCVFRSKCIHLVYPNDWSSTDPCPNLQLLRESQLKGNPVTFR